MRPDAEPTTDNRQPSSPPHPLTSLTPFTPQGFAFSGVRCGLKNKRNDLGILLSDRPARAAGAFTRNEVRASSVDFSRQAVARGVLRALVVNSGNANCCTGPQGERDTARMAELTAAALRLGGDDIAVASTGVIGQLLDMAKVERGIEAAAGHLGPDPRPFMDAILTTDLVEKWASTRVPGADCAGTGGSVRIEAPAPWGATEPDRNPPAEAAGLITGFAKGSGMIAPNMATMLGFIATDLDTSAFDLQAVLSRAVERSFNRMTVDGDTSTNDMVLLLANGASGVCPDPEAFESALTAVCDSLARQVARDGEGATKLVEVRVAGSADPVRIARTIAESPLVKTAMFGCDPNWGRILMAAGHAGVPFRLADVRLALLVADEEHVLFESDGPAPYDPKRVSTALKSDNVIIDLHVGEGESATIYTCDLGYGYVRINAEYHT